ncbi:MAG TPA: DUF4159 domain-containing protein [Tepidisphaeraceae bacterium]|nr:DUF4159 domain-containing protein [Tepidisphaeraceae bacterium]
MAINIRCPDCGKRARLSDSQAGHRAICAACGNAFTLPGKILELAAADASIKGGTGSDVSRDAETPNAFGSHHGIGRVGWLAIGVGGVLVAGLLALLVWTTLQKGQLAEERAQADTLRSDAHVLTARGDFERAHVKYRQLSDFLAAHHPNDPQLKILRQRAGADDEHVFKELVARAAASARAARLRPKTTLTALAATAPATTQPKARLVVVAASRAANPSGKDTSQSPDRSGVPANNISPATRADSAPNSLPATDTAASVPASSALHADLVSVARHRPPRIARPPVQLVAQFSDELGDAQIGRAIQAGVNHLIGEFDPRTFELNDGAVIRRRGMRGAGNGIHDGADALCVYALLQCGQAVSDPRLNLHATFMTGCIEAMKRYPMDEQSGYTTYGRGIRATALALFDRKEDHQALAADVLWLLKVQKNGGYSYVKSNGNYDNSNSQYGLLGVWSGAEAGIEVPNAYWQLVENHWTACQDPNGQWGYGTRNGGSGTLTMTCAGIASMFVCHDWLDGPKFGASVGRDPFSGPLKRGLEWMEQGDHSVGVSRSIGGHWGYALYGIERVGLASGFKFFGNHNWYPELSRVVLAAQHADGSWGDNVNTAYALLFLSRGRHPIMMNKLRFDGYWANRPRDVANLAKEAGEKLERPINWQVVPLKRDWTDWLDSPILYLASHKPPNLSDADVQKIRQYVEAGGMLFVQADGDAIPMTGFARELGHRLFPKYELADVPRPNPLFSSLYRLPSHPALKMVNNGSRILMLFSPTDISKRWQLREQNGMMGKPAFELGINMFVYAAGKRDLRNRLESNYIGPIAGTPSLTIKIARVQYAGNWDPEPYAWTRFARWFHQQTGYALDVEPVAMRDLDAKTYHFAALTGTAAYNPTAAEVAAIKKFVEAGGVLFTDLTGGTGAFDSAIRDSLLSVAWPGTPGTPHSLSASHPLYQPGNNGILDLTRARLNSYAIEKLGSTPGQHLSEIAAGAGHVLFTSLDVTSGLLNTNTWGIVGFEPAYSQALMKNAILWTLDGQRDE